MGYAGGTKKNPTYRAIGDHTESFQVDFDPAVVSYEKLLEIFWTTHDPTARAWSRQYRAVIYVDGEEQRKAAERSKAEREEKLGETVRTPILDPGVFTPAEDYHQKYYMRGRRSLMKIAREILLDDESIRESTAAARLNGFLAGYGPLFEVLDAFKAEGLSEKGLKALTDILAPLDKKREAMGCGG